ncbi:MAG: DUF5711 family protein [Lachnospiraceae bacterium]|nr:DUF5711 family protein [Lachnospiraceae bacterium]
MAGRKQDTNDNGPKLVDKKEFEARHFRLRARRFAIGAVLVAAVLIVVFVIYKQISEKVYTEYEVIGTVDWTPVSGTTVLPYGSDLVSYSADGIHCTNAKGQDLWSFSYVMQNPMVEVQGDYVAVADHGGRKVYIYDRTGLIGEIEVNNPVRSICLSGGGVVAAVLDDGDTAPIYLYYRDGTPISYFRTTMSRSGYPAAIGISDSGKLVGVSYFYLDSGQLTSHVAFYNFDEVGKNETDNLVCGYEYRGELVPMVRFMDEDSAFAVANDRLVIYEGKQRPQDIANRLLQDEIRSVYYGKDYVGLVYFDRSGEGKYRMEVYDAKGNQKCELHFDQEYNDIRFAGENILIYNSASCQVYTTKGRLKFQGTFESSVYLMLPGTNPTSCILVTDQGIQTIQLK